MAARRIAVLDAPSNLGLRPPTATSVPGCAKAPGALRDHGLLARLGAIDAGCITPPRYDPADWQPGDGVAQSEDIALFSRRLADRIGALLADGQFPVVLGGDCSVLIGAGLAMRRHESTLDGRVGLVYVDGHSDFRHQGNASYVGAAAGEALALVTGRGQPNLSSIEHRRPYFRDVDVVLLGIRAHDEYRLDLQAAGIVGRAVPELRSDGAARSAQWARGHLADCAGYWVHIDVDVLDPAVMPAVDAPDVGGIAYTELELLLAGLVSTPQCLGVEVTVFDPDYDPDGVYAREVADTLVAGLAPLLGAPPVFTDPAPPAAAPESAPGIAPEAQPLVAREAEPAAGPGAEAGPAPEAPPYAVAPPVPPHAMPPHPALLHPALVDPTWGEPEPPELGIADSLPVEDVAAVPAIPATSASPPAPVEDDQPIVPHHTDPAEPAEVAEPGELAGSAVAAEGHEPADPDATAARDATVASDAAVGAGFVDADASEPDAAVGDGPAGESAAAARDAGSRPDDQRRPDADWFGRGGLRRRDTEPSADGLGSGGLRRRDTDLGPDALGSGGLRRRDTDLGPDALGSGGLRRRDTAVAPDVEAEPSATAAAEVDPARDDELDDDADQSLDEEGRGLDDGGVDPAPPGEPAVVPAARTPLDTDIRTGR